LLARRLRDADDALVATNFLSLKGRLARALLSLAEAFGRDIGQGRILIRQKVSQSDLAAIAGIARENVSRVLNDWANTRWRDRTHYKPPEPPSTRCEHFAVPANCGGPTRCNDFGTRSNLATVSAALWPPQQARERPNSAAYGWLSQILRVSAGNFRFLQSG
jgi:Crp-like helix-turn-helix domain